MSSDTFNLGEGDNSTACSVGRCSFNTISSQINSLETSLGGGRGSLNTICSQANSFETSLDTFNLR